MSTPPAPYSKFTFDTEFFEVVGTGVGTTAAARQSEAQNLKEHAYAEGYNAGLAEAQQGAQADLAQLQQNLQNTLIALQKGQDEREAQLVTQLLGFLRVTLHHIVGHAAAHYGPELLETHLRSLLASLKTDETLTLRIHPSARGFHEKLQLPQASILGLPMQITPDTTLGPTDAVVEWRNGGVESRVAAHLAELDQLLASVGAAALPMNVAPPSAATEEAEETPAPAPATPTAPATPAASADASPLTDAAQAAKARAAELLGDDDLVDALKS